MGGCPKFVHLRAADGEKDSDAFQLIDDANIANIRAIRANTPFPASVRILCCQNIKTKEPNYCNMENIHEAHADKRACESSETKYVAFYVDQSEKNEKSPVYLLAFVRDGDLAHEVEAIGEELKRTAGWLDCTNNIIHCYIFCYTATPRATVRNDAVVQKHLKKSSGFICSIRSVPIRLPRVLYVNGGSPRFNIIVQEAQFLLQSKP
jgi:hypothetical protein